ncbi:PA14 domain-containing protein [Dyadobacter tibetensis]|uniref:PA14 domain-containing protein n=1 Tax=Dyadobacter tibetensis TaxID=1211851 RepID=UPI00046EB5B0|nr:PA14 domain-containing protein [Dyadobacter tibetensis]
MMVALLDGSVLYEQFIEITGPNGYYVTITLDSGGRGRWNYGTLPTGFYNVRAVRQYPGGWGRIATNTTVEIYGGCRINPGTCPTDEDNGSLITILTDTQQACYAVKANGVWVAVLDNGTFISRERLMANGLSVEGANCFAATDPQGSAPPSTCAGLGSITYQRWDGISGNTIDELINGSNNFQNNASVTQNLNMFEAPSDIADNYGVRMRGYICPPTTGIYTFWLAGDDNAELWLSSDQNPDNSELIAFHSAWTPSREWSWFSTQRSFPITLQANQKYYIEARMKEGSGGDNLAVGWQLPNGSLERPIPGNRLAPFGTVVNPSSCDFNISAGNSNSNPSANQGLQLNYSCSGANCSGVSYAWSGNGISGSATPLSITAPGSAGSYTYTVTGSKSGCPNKTATTSITVGNPPSTCDCGFSLLSATQNSGQYTASFQFNSCSVSQVSWSMLSGSTVVASGTENVTAATVPFTVPSGVYTGNYTLKVDVLNCTGTGTVAFNYTKPGGNTTINCTTLNGHFDGANCGTMGGWAYDYSNPNTPVNIDILEGSTVIQSNIPAANFRQDLLNAGIGNGVHGFEINTPSSLKNGQNRVLSARVSGCSFVLNNSPRTINCSSGARIGVQEAELETPEMETQTNTLLIVSPNPNNGEFNVDFDLPIGEKATLTVYETTGNAIFERSLVGKGTHQEKVKLADSSAGIYLVELRKANGIKVKKILVLK